MEQTSVELSLSIGESIKQRRKEKGMTQAELSEATGIPLSSLKKYEQGTRNPKLEALFKLNEVLDLREVPSLFSQKSNNLRLPGELYQIENLLLDNNFKIFSREERHKFLTEIEEYSYVYDHTHCGTLGAIEYEKTLTHELLDEVLTPYEEQPIFDIFKVLSNYLMLNYDGKEFLMKFLNILCDNKNFIQKNYDPFEKRPSDHPYNDTDLKTYYESYIKRKQTPSE